MGRCNNRRTQQAAQSLRNTPARARFSAPPPRRKTAGRGRGGRSGGGSQQQQQQKPNNNRNKASVIAKLSQRVQAGGPSSSSSNQHHRTTTTTITSKTNNDSLVLGRVDLSKLEQLTLSESSLQIIDKLLQDLGVITKIDESLSSPPDGGGDEDERLQFETLSRKEGEAKEENISDDLLPDAADNDDDDDDVDWEEDDADVDTAVKQTGAVAAVSQYEEYEHDNEDDYLPETSNNMTAIMAGFAAADETEWHNGSNRSEVDTAVDIVKKWQSDPVFHHLTQKLSFQPLDAARACQAVENWPAAAASDTKTSQPQKQQQQQQASRLVHVMDWMCLHLLEDDLKRGFQRNSDYQQSFSGDKKHSSTSTSSSSILLAGTGRTKPIPHPSISVAVKLTEDREWSRMTRLEQRAVGFLPLGFLHGEILQVLQQESEDTEDNYVEAIQNSKVLRRLLTTLEEQLLSSETAEEKYDTLVVNEEDVQMERDMEKEALVAIYDTEFETLEDNGSGLGRYKISMNIECCPENDTELLVFLRANYPATEYPLFLINNPSLPWPFLRQMNIEIIALLREVGVGVPLIFEVASHVMETLPERLNEFHKIQRAKEFEQAQLRLRREAGHRVEQDSSSLDFDEDAKVGRRQRSRAKAAEVAFEGAEEAQQRDEERKRQQEKRLEKIREESRYVRQSMADRVIEQREVEKHKEGIRRAGRSAMNAAFNHGASVWEAREAAQKAEAAYRKDHGLELDNVETQLKGESRTAGEIEATGPKQDTKSTREVVTPAQVGATPTTAAFMERLRNMYSAAAKEKQQVTLCEPQDAGDGEESETELPQPVPPLTREFSEMVDDIIAVQNEQPWLVSSEARVPTKTIQIANGPMQNSSSRQHGINDQLKKQFERKGYLESNRESAPSPQMTKKLDKIQEQRRGLPAYCMRQEIAKTIRENQITLIRGETGCGKTTQCPQLVLADMLSSNRGSEANIIVTQPRRISAMGVAERIASELGERVGATCGYSIKLEKKYSKDTRVLLCTTGILLRRLQVDPDLATVSHIFVDEVHERDLLTDFLLIVLKKLVERRKSLRLVLMSATVSAETFANYFASYGCAHVDIPGRAFPVEEYRLEDILQQTGYEVQEESEYAVKPSPGSESGRLSKSALRKLYYPRYDSKVIHSLSIINESVLNYELLAELLEHIINTTQDGAILVFMPGMMEIVKVIDEMRRREVFQTDRVVIYPLHSTLSTAEQSRVFDVPPVGTRKIVVSTNIAETSITIEDVVYVVDSGRVKENRRDEVKETPALVDCWVSRSSAKQRRGRAGRVRPGIAYHLFSSHTHDNDLAEYILPEILRVGVEELTLQILVLDLGEPHIFLGGAIDAPSGLAMRNALSVLEELGAIECTWHSTNWDVEKCLDLDVSVELTALGFHLATLPVEPRVGKIMIYGAILGCVEASLTLAASMSAKNLFVSSFDNRDAADEARREVSLDNSDMLTVLAVFNDFQEIRAKKGNRGAQQFTKDHFLNRSALFQIIELRKQYSRLLVDIGFLPKDFALSNFQDFRSQDLSLIKAVLCAGLYPNIIVAPNIVLLDGARSKKQISEIPFQSRRSGDVYLHPCTLLSTTGLPLENRYFCFHEIVKTSKLYIRDCTAVTPFSLLLFGGALKLYHEQGVVSVDDWLKFRIAAQPATFAKHLRKHLESMLFAKIIFPNEHDEASRHSRALIEAVKTVLENEKPVSQADSVVFGTERAEIVRPWHGTDHEVMMSRQEREGRGGGRLRGGRGAGRDRGGRKGRH